MLARTARLPATTGELPDAAAQIVACLDGPFTATYGDLVGRGGGSSADADIFADPFLDGPGSPRLALLLLRGGWLHNGAHKTGDDRQKSKKRAHQVLHQD